MSTIVYNPFTDNLDYRGQSGGGNDHGYHVARYIVSAGGLPDGANYTTIAAAYAAAVSAGGPQTVFVQPGTYTENITLSASVNITAFDCDSTTPNVIISGTVTANYTGAVSLSGIRLQTNGATFLTCSGTTTGIIYFDACFLSATNNNGMALSNPNFVVYVANTLTSTATSRSLFVITATNGVEFNQCRVSASDGTVSTISSGFVTFVGCTVGTVVSTSLTGMVIYRNCNVSPTSNTTALATSGTGVSTFTNCNVDTGSATNMIIGTGSGVILANCCLSSSATNVVSGTGNLAYSGISFYGASSQFDVGLTLGLISSTPANAVSGAVWTSTGTNTSPIWQVKPSFVAYLSSTVSDVTGDGTVYPIVYDATTSNIGSAYSTVTGLFTAPATGNYQFNVTTCYQDGAGSNAFGESLDGSAYSNRLSQVGAGVLFAGVYLTTSSQLVHMTAGDTIGVHAVAYGGTKVVDLIGGALTGFASSCVFSGFRV